MNEGGFVEWSLGNCRVLSIEIKTEEIPCTIQTKEELEAFESAEEGRGAGLDGRAVRK